MNEGRNRHVAIGPTERVCDPKLRLAEPIPRRLGKTGAHVLDCVLELILAWNDGQFMFNGPKAAELLPVAKRWG